MRFTPQINGGKNIKWNAFSVHGLSELAVLHCIHVRVCYWLQKSQPDTISQQYIALCNQNLASVPWVQLPSLDNAQLSSR